MKGSSRKPNTPADRLTGDTNRPIRSKLRYRSACPTSGAATAPPCSQRRLVLVVGESDEIIVGAFSRPLRIALAAAGVEIMQSGGAPAFTGSHTPFRLLGKRIVILADLDSLAEGDMHVKHIDGDKPAQRATRQGQTRIGL